MKSKAPHRISQTILRILLRHEHYIERSGDLEEAYREIRRKNGPVKSFIWYSFQLSKIILMSISNMIIWEAGIFRHNLKIALRGLTNRKFYTLINILGLSISLTCFFLILLYVRFELSFDDYHHDSDRIYRVAVSKINNGSTRSFAINSALVAPTLEENYQEIEAACRIMMLPTDKSSVKYQNQVFYESKVGYVDPEFLEMFRLSFLLEGREDMLDRPDSVILTQRISEKYFGRENPLGKTIQINQAPYEIIGVVDNFPDNTHLKVDLLVSMKSRADSSTMTNWHYLPCYNYIKLAVHVDPIEFEGKIKSLAHRYIGEELKEMGTEIVYFLQPVQQIHLQSHLQFESEPPGNSSNITVFTAVAVLILLIACFNFINLTTALAGKRRSEVAMKKVVGVRRSQLIRQFIQESTMTSLGSFFLAALFVLTSIPMLNSLAGTAYTVSDLLRPGMIFTVLTAALLTGVLSGIYPAFYITRFPAVTLFKGRVFFNSKKSMLRRLLVIAQFAISITMIIGSMIVYKQVEFMKSRPLGFNKEQKLVVKIPGISKDNLNAFKADFKSHSSISDVTMSFSVPGKPIFTRRISPVDNEEAGQSVQYLSIDFDFYKVYDIGLIAGREFRLDDREAAGFILNRAAVDFFGFNSPEDALGKELMDFEHKRSPIIGVTDTFHWRGLQQRIDPLVMCNESSFSYITLLVKTDNIKETIDFTRGRYRDMFPETPFEYFFLDTDFDRQYKTEDLTKRITGIFTCIGMFIACLGLIGLTAHTAEQSRKEIGVRKVMGASVSNIMGLLAREFLKWISLGMILAWAASYLIMSHWLGGFAYRVNIGIPLFLISGIAALTIALLIVGFQSMKAASANPVDSLKYE